MNEALQQPCLTPYIIISNPAVSTHFINRRVLQSCHQSFQQIYRKEVKGNNVIWIQIFMSTYCPPPHIKNQFVISFHILSCISLLFNFIFVDDLLKWSGKVWFASQVKEVYELILVAHKSQLRREWKFTFLYISRKLWQVYRVKQDLIKLHLFSFMGVWDEIKWRLCRCFISWQFWDIFYQISEA